MNWSEEIEPNNDIPYNHVLLDTPLGQASIEWKGWKKQPTYGVTINNDYIGTDDRLEGAKLIVLNHLVSLNKILTKFVNNTL